MSNPSYYSTLESSDINDELLFRHIFEIQIHIQTQIPKTFILSLTANDFLQLLKVSQRVKNNQFIEKKSKTSEIYYFVDDFGHSFDITN